MASDEFDAEDAAQAKAEADPATKQFVYKSEYGDIRIFYTYEDEIVRVISSHMNSRQVWPDTTVQMRILDAIYDKEESDEQPGTA